MKLTSESLEEKNNLTERKGIAEYMWQGCAKGTFAVGRLHGCRANGEEEQAGSTKTECM